MHVQHTDTFWILVVAAVIFVLGAYVEIKFRIDRNRTRRDKAADEVRRDRRDTLH